MEKVDPQHNEELLIELLRQGDAAARLLDGDVGEAAIIGPELECIRAWTRSEPEQRDLRESLWHDFRALGKVRRRLTNAKAKGIDAGKRLHAQED
jgi:hypothetical protein